MFPPSPWRRWLSPSPCWWTHARRTRWAWCRERIHQVPSWHVQWWASCQTCPDRCWAWCLACVASQATYNTNTCERTQHTISQIYKCEACSTGCVAIHRPSFSLSSSACGRHTTTTQVDQHTAATNLCTQQQCKRFNTMPQSRFVTFSFRKRRKTFRSFRFFGFHLREKACTRKARQTRCKEHSELHTQTHCQIKRPMHDHDIATLRSQHYQTSYIVYT